MFLSLGGYEAGILWRFLDGVSAAVSTRMVHGSSPAEENLTFLLCELLDANATSLHARSYPLSQAQTDLEASDSGITLDVEFETHEHSRHVESRYSGADLGIVLAVNHPVFGQSRRGVLVQAKRLFGKGRKREYGLFSNYSSFDKKQADFLQALEKRFSAWNSVYYLWYNPPSTAFPDADAKVLRAYDASGGSPYQHWHRMHPFIDELIEMGIPGLLAGGSPRSAPSAEGSVKRSATAVRCLRRSRGAAGTGRLYWWNVFWMWLSSSARLRVKRRPQPVGCSPRIRSQQPGMRVTPLTSRGVQFALDPGE
jgi:hypothetical protein